MQKRIGLAATVVAAAALVLPAVASAAKPAGPEHVRAAFFTNWSRYARGYTVKQIPADKLNVIDYAFAFPSAAGTCILSDAWSDFQAPTWSGTDSVDGVADDPLNPNQHLFGNFNQLRKLKAAHPGLRLEISIGGWTGSTYFSDVAASAASRQAVVHRPVHPRQPPDRRLARAGGRRRRRGRPLRRHQPRLGVPGRRPRQRCALLADRPRQRDGASPGVPPPARPGGPLRRKALHAHERHPRWKRELRRELAAP